MRYMLLIYSREDDSASEEEMRSISMRHAALLEETARQGILRGADPLAVSSTATTVRMQGTDVMLTDGPFAETKEQLAGYYLLDCKDLDEAIQWASKIPTACQGRAGCVEIRPIRDIPGMPVNG
jgi:hypothetical protein